MTTTTEPSQIVKDIGSDIADRLIDILKDKGFEDIRCEGSELSDNKGDPALILHITGASPTDSDPARRWYAGAAFPMSDLLQGIMPENPRPVWELTTQRYITSLSAMLEMEETPE